MHGFTTIRDLESEGAMYADVDLKKAINNGIIDGPRMFVATRSMSTTGHYPLRNSAYAWEITVPKGVQEITGADEARRAVREQISYGADWIKIYADRGYYRLPDGTFRGLPNFSQDEINAIGDEVRLEHKKFAAHAVTRDGIIYAINAGASSIEHGFGMDDECIELMAAKGVYWCPTIYVNVWVAEGRAAAGNPINKAFNEVLPVIFAQGDESRGEDCVRHGRRRVCVVGERSERIFLHGKIRNDADAGNSIGNDYGRHPPRYVRQTW